MSPSQNAVIFDWNGTILADTRLSLAAMNKTLAAFGVAPVSLAAYREAYTVPFVHMYKQFGCAESELQARQAEIFETFGGHYEKNEKSVRLRKGARGTLDTMKGRGYSTGILSNYVTARISQQTRRLRIDHCFDAVLANDDAMSGFYKKGKGERLKAFMEKHEIRRALIVGDTPEEIEIAHAYGCHGVAITDGVCSVARLRAAKPDYLIRNLDEINDIAKKIFERTGK